MDLIDLSRLPEPLAVEKLDFETILAALVDDFRARWPEFTAVLESDPGIKLLEVAAWRETILRARINDAYKAGTLAFAAASDLDQVGAFHGVERLSNEQDAAYRARVQQGYWRLAASGPAAAFVAHAMGAHPDVVDAEAWTAGTGSAQLAVLAAVVVDDSGLTDQQRARLEALSRRAFHGRPSPGAGQWLGVATMLDTPMKAARARVTGDDVLPLGMDIGVRPATLIEFDVSARLVLYPGADESQVLTEASRRVDAYLLSVARLNHDVTRAGLLAALFAPGVQNVALDSPITDVVTGHGDLALSLAETIVVEASRNV